MTKDFIPSFGACTHCGITLPQRESDIKRHYKAAHKINVSIAKAKYRINKRKTVKTPNRKVS